MRLAFLFFTLFLSFSFTHITEAQVSRTDYELKQKMKKAIILMDSGDYKNANSVFRNILATEKVLPTNLSYHFALTLYHIKQYKNSESFLNKYLDLSGKGGDFYDQALELRKLLNKAFVEIQECSLCDNNGYKYTTCSVCNGTGNVVEECSKCQAVGKVSCLKCKGEGVVITTDVFGDKKYQTCDKCNGKGIHTCDLCNGKKELDLVCNVCLGTGKESSKQICNHEH